MWREAGAAFLVLGALLAAVLIYNVAATGTYYAALPWLNQQQTYANQSSQGYIEAKQSQLLRLTRDGFALEAEIQQAREAQQQKRADDKTGELIATLDRIEQDAATIDRTYVPQQTKDLLARHGRRI